MNNKSKKIIVTGSHGYIGSVLCYELENLGWTIECIDNGYFTDCLINDKSKESSFIKKHLDNITSSDLANVWGVIHLAGLQNDPLKKTVPGKVYDIEYEYTKRLVKLCLNLNIKFIYASSCSVYGTANTDLVNEESPVNPLTPYSQNKLRIEKYLFSIANENFNPIMLRFATVYGYSPRMRFDLYINMFVGMALAEKSIQLNSDGMAWRPNLYIGDIPKIIHKALKLNLKKPTIINIGNYRSNSRVVDIIEIIKNILNDISTSILGSESNELYGDQYVTSKKDKRSYSVDFSKMRGLLGDDLCPTDLNEGIGLLINQLKTINNLDNKIKDIHFFRLQWTQELIRKNKIDDHFKWS